MYIINKQNTYYMYSLNESLDLTELQKADAAREAQQKRVDELEQKRLEQMQKSKSQGTSSIIIILQPILTLLKWLSLLTP